MGSFWIPGGGEADTTADIFKHRRTGMWHDAAHVDRAIASENLLADTFYAVPFYAPVDITVTDIGIHSPVGAGDLAAIGIYEDDGNCYPGALLLDAGQVDVSTGGDKIIAALSQALDAGNLYWLVVLLKANWQMRTRSTISSPAIFGTTIISQGGFNYWAVAQAWGAGALPGAYPGGGTLTAVDYPLIAIKF